MIKTFKDKETLMIFERNFSKRLPPEIQRVAARKLWMLDAAPDINALRVPPSNRLEALSGKRKRST